MNDQLIEAVTDELLAHGEFSSTGNNRPNARAAAQAVIDIILRSSADSADDLRSAGWMVAVHNDYRLNGKPHTFWLFTKGDRAIKGEGDTDQKALDQCRALAGAEPQTAPAAPPAMSEGRYWTNQLNACWDRSMSDALKTAAQKALNYIENTEGELGMTLSCGDALRAALADTENQRSQAESVLVPKPALDWLFGVGPGPDGKSFDDDQDAEERTPRKYSRRYWWRSKFSSMIPALTRPQCATPTSPGASTPARSPRE
jgi:hypothetical protein